MDCRCYLACNQSGLRHIWLDSKGKTQSIAYRGQDTNPRNPHHHPGPIHCLRYNPKLLDSIQANYCENTQKCLESFDMCNQLYIAAGRLASSFRMMMA